MDALEMFLRDHAVVHSARVAEAEGQFSLEDGSLRGLSDEQIRLRPGGWNSLAWLLWHMARCEDVAANVIVAGRRQVLDEGDWARRLRVDRRDIGTGMSDDEVADLSVRIDVPSLREYRVAVGRRTREVARALPPRAWDEIVDAAAVQRAVAVGAFGPNAGRLAGFWEGKSRAWFLYWLAVGHNYWHLGQAAWVREMILTP
ncbi:MAG: DinB family protein [Armatimonadota bacterium]|nr:DinB family protein [Armatimonadota bacterium]